MVAIQKISDDEKRSFTSWKLNILDAMSFDTALRGDTFRFAYRLIQHINSSSKIAWPSLELLAAQMGISRARAMAHAKLLEERKWIIRKRSKRNSVYEYSFSDANMNQCLDEKELRVQDFNTLRKEKLEVAYLRRRKLVEVVDLDLPEAPNLENSEVPETTHKHLSNNYLNGTPEISSKDIDKTGLGDCGTRDRISA